MNQQPKKNNGATMGLISTIENDIRNMEVSGTLVERITGIGHEHVNNWKWNRRRISSPKYMFVLMENGFIPDRIDQLVNLIEQIYHTGLTDKEVSVLTGIPYSTANHVLNGRCRNYPTTKILEKFEKIGLIVAE